MAFCDRQLSYYNFFVFLHSSKLWGEGYYFRLFVMKMTIQRDDDVLLSGFLLANAASTESGGQPEVVKWCC
jgi:hypothetical protein